MNDSSFSFDEMFCFSLYSSSNAIMRFYAKPLKELGITYPQLLVLVALWEQDELSVSMISQKTSYDLGSLNPILKRLEKAGFILTSIDPLDRRRRNVKLTNKGLKLKEPVAQIFENMRCAIDLTEEEFKMALNIFRKIKKTLNT